jgi:hypothetical protein
MASNSRKITQPQNKNSFLGICALLFLGKCALQAAHFPLSRLDLAFFKIKGHDPFPPK